MYAVTVSDHVMLAHSLRGAVFGPAQRLHGATYVVEVSFRRAHLDADGIVVDIGRALEALSATLAPLKFQNLDTLPEFATENSTTEVLCRWVWDRIAAAVARGELGGDSATALTGLGVTLRETPNAWASFEAPLPAGR